MNAPATQTTWREDAWHRLGANGWIKLTGISGFMTVFFVAYFFVLKHPAFPVTVMPLTEIDGWIPFQPGAVWLYVSLWIYAPLAAALIRERGDLFRHAAAATATGLLGLVVFYLWPTTVPLTEIDWTKHPVLLPLKSADASGNACPSLHVAFAILAAVALEYTLRAMRSSWVLRTLNFAWCLGILFSTIAVRQHVFVDVVGGIALGIAGGFFLRPTIVRTQQTSA